MGSNDINDKLLIPKIVETYKDKPSILEFKCGNCGIIFKRSVANISGRVRKQTVQNAIENKPVVTFCSHQCYNKYSKDHNIGMHSKESKENNKIKQIENAKKGIGAWSDEAKAIKAKKRKEHVKNKTGAWSYEARVKQCETKKKNGTNQYDPNVTRKTFQTQYNNKIGIFSEEGRANQSKWLTEFNKRRLHNEFCDKCNKITLHNASICSVCNPETLGGLNTATKPNFIEGNHCNLHKNESLMYKGECWSCFREKFKSLRDSYFDLPEIPKSIQCKYCNNIINNSNDKFCSIKCKELFEIEKYKDFKNNNYCRIHRNNNTTYKGICWGCFKESFSINKSNLFIVELKNDEMINKFDSFWQNTYRINEHNRTGQDAMEMELKEKDIRWFIYIKFYINENDEIIPLVVGKSGSLLVNKTGTDINFSIKDVNKPARRFLNDYGYQWFTDKIYIISVNNEEQAYFVESYIHNKYNLFYS